MTTAIIITDVKDMNNIYAHLIHNAYQNATSIPCFEVLPNGTFVQHWRNLVRCSDPIKDFGNKTSKRWLS